MSKKPQEEPFSEASLNSPEYRERLMRKLNCLIAVLEVATAKVKKSLEGPSVDIERLARIRTNLQNTLDVCVRARAALERREALPKELPENLAQVIHESKPEHSKLQAADQTQPRGAAVEMSSADERKKFAKLGPINRAMVARADVEALSRKLQGG